MKRSAIALLALILITACHQKDEYPQDATETGRAFIRASLNGDFKDAERYLLQDTQNAQLFDSYKTYYERLPAEKKNGYKDAAYTINKYSDLNDSTSIINYSNSFMNKPMEIKVVRVNKTWKVDFKYTYAGTADQK